MKQQKDGKKILRAQNMLTGYWKNNSKRCFTEVKFSFTNKPKTLESSQIKRIVCIVYLPSFLTHSLTLLLLPNSFDVPLITRKLPYNL